LQRYGELTIATNKPGYANQSVKMSSFFRRYGNAVSNAFILTAALVLTTTAAAKLYSAGGSARILQAVDPVFQIQFRSLFLGVAAIELAAAGVSLSYRSRMWPVALIAWLSTLFALYRGSAWFLAEGKPCPCLGALTETLQMPQRVADGVMLLLLAYLIVGSYSILWCNAVVLRKGRDSDENAPVSIPDLRTKES